MKTTTQTTGRFLSKSEVDTAAGFAGAGYRAAIREDIAFQEALAGQIRVGIRAARELRDRAREARLEEELRLREHSIKTAREELRGVK